MATIGRLAAVAKIEWPFKAHWSGFPAWLTWLIVHIYFLIGFRNRIFVLLEWAYTYFTFTRGARLITGDQHLPGWTEQKGVDRSWPGALDMTSPGAHGTQSASLSTAFWRGKVLIAAML